MITPVVRFLLIFGIVGVSAFGAVTGIGERFFPQLGEVGFIPQTVVLALLLWFILWRISKHREMSREKEYHAALEEMRSKIETMARARSQGETDKKMPDHLATGAFKLESASGETVTVFNKEAGNEVNEQLSYMLHFMSYNFKAYTAAAFIYDPHRRMLALNCYHSKSVNIIEKVQIPFGSGVVGKVASENRLFMSGDISFYNSDSSGHSYYSPPDGASSVLAVPVTVGNTELLGVLLIDSKDKNVFREQDKELMKRFSTIAAALIVNIRMSVNLEQAAKTFRLFYEASHNFSVALKMDEIFNALFTVIPRINSSCVRLVFTAFDANQNCFVIQRVAGQKFELNEGMELPVAPGLYSFAFNKKKVVNIPDLAAPGNKHYRFAPNEPANPAIRSFIVFPIISGDDGTCVGLFSVESSVPGLFSGQVEQILTTIIENASVAINRSLLYSKMEKLATIDGLTGLNNHRTFQGFMDKELERAQRYNRPLSLLLTDIDHFKSFNDTYGHPVGDLVLREVAACIRNAVRTNDIPARYGGEEFAVVVPESDENGAAIIAERIRRSVEGCVIVNDGKELRVTISIGCASFPPHAQTKQDMIDCADKALYAAKRSGRNRVCVFSPEMTMSSK